jgi:hypothetical protein
VLKIVHTTVEYLKIPLTAWSGDVSDPTTLPVEIAVTTGAAPAEDDWVTAAWVTEDSVVKARVLWPTAMPAAAPHTTYMSWLRITATPEAPELRCGAIQTY